MITLPLRRRASGFEAEDMLSKRRPLVSNLNCAGVTGELSSTRFKLEAGL